MLAHPGLGERYVTDIFEPEDAGAAFQLAVRPARGQMKIVIRC